MSEPSQKRKAPSHTQDGKAKKPKNWQMPKQLNRSKAGKEIHIGDTGIWVTCDRGREGKCAAEIVDLLDEYAQRLYSDVASTNADNEDNEDNEDENDELSDIEKAISSELSDMKKAKSNSLFSVIRPEIACVLFIKTKSPVDPVSLVHTICKDAASGTMSKRYRSVKRLTPAASTEKAHESNFEDLATRIVKPVFHAKDLGSKKFAIRYTSRNNSILKRDEVIQKTAALVGDTHKVDLDDPDLVILVDVYKNICTMAIVDGDYNSLKKYNLAEIGNTDLAEVSNETSRLSKIGKPADI